MGQFEFTSDIVSLPQQFLLHTPNIAGAPRWKRESQTMFWETAEVVSLLEHRHNVVLPPWIEGKPVLKGIWRWLRIVGFVVALMSGPLSLVRELYSIYNPNPIQSAVLFWHCVWIAFILSAVTVWIAEYKRADALAQEIAGLKARPLFSGHIYQFNIHARTGIVPPKMLQEVLDISADRNKRPRSELKEDCDVFVEACIVNEVSAVGTVIEYELEVERGGQTIKPRSEPGFLGFNQMRIPYRIDSVTGERIAEGPRCEDVPDLVGLTKKPMQQGHSVEGWLHFVVEQINPLTLETDPIRLRKLTAIDCYGSRHDIAKGWTGDRQTFIEPDVLPANSN